MILLSLHCEYFDSPCYRPPSVIPDILLQYACNRAHAASFLRQQPRSPPLDLHILCRVGTIQACRNVYSIPYKICAVVLLAGTVLVAVSLGLGAKLGEVVLLTISKLVWVTWVTIGVASVGIAVDVLVGGIISSVVGIFVIVVRRSQCCATSSHCYYSVQITREVRNKPEVHDEGFDFVNPTFRFLRIGEHFRTWMELQVVPAQKSISECQS